MMWGATLHGLARNGIAVAALAMALGRHLPRGGGPYAAACSAAATEGQPSRTLR